MNPLQTSDDDFAPIIQFLLGCSNYEGVWFGDYADTERGRYWWRDELRAYARAALTERPAQPSDRYCETCERRVTEPCNSADCSTPERDQWQTLVVCPFCGGEGDYCETGVFWVRCQSCYADAASSESKEEAAALWNRRAVLALAAPAVPDPWKQGDGETNAMYLERQGRIRDQEQQSVELTRDTNGMCVVKVNGREVIRDNGDVISHYATPEWLQRPAAQSAAPAVPKDAWPSYIAGIIETYLQSNPKLDVRERAIAGIIERRMWVAAPPVQAEPMTRFCPGCGSVGTVPDKFRDCCPDGSHARMVPESLAKRCHHLFQLAISNAAQPSTAAQSADAVAVDAAAFLRLLRNWVNVSDLDEFADRLEAALSQSAAAAKEAT